MSKISQSLLKGANEALDYARGNKAGAKTHKITVLQTVDVRAIRKKLRMTRNEFADQFGFNSRTLEKWEQGVRNPEKAARAYLMVINYNHKTVETALKNSK